VSASAVAVSGALWRVFRVPAAIALASAVGLVSALVADGVWDAVSWLALGGAAAVGVWCALVRERGTAPWASAILSPRTTQPAAPPEPHRQAGELVARMAPQEDTR
jgi:hypothetical protein